MTWIEGTFAVVGALTIGLILGVVIGIGLRQVAISLRGSAT